MATASYPPRPPCVRSAGFTLVELAVVLGILGLLAMGMSSAFDSIEHSRQQNAARAHAEAARQALRAFALRNKRLPCPDTSAHGDVGREVGGGDCSLDTSSNIGWLPYESLGLEIPQRAVRLRYGVYRGQDIDLAAPSPVSVDGPDLEGSGGFLSALTAAAAKPPSTAQPYYLTGTVGPASCAADPSRTINPAFVVVAPAADRDHVEDDHPGFDGIHRAFAAGESRCTAAPGHPGDATFDDVVSADSLTALLGWLMVAGRH